MDLSKNIPLTARISTISAIVSGITGTPPIISYQSDHVSIKFTDQQKQIIQQMIEKELSAKPGEIRIDWNALILPPTLRVYGKYAIMALLASFLIGKLTSK